MKSLVEAIQKAGVVGAGGGGFPTHIKVNTMVDTVIVNGCECEPLLHADEAILHQHTHKVLEALGVVMDKTGATKGFVAMKEKKKIAIPKPYHLSALPDVYPLGDELILTYEVIGRVVGEGKLPPSVGVLVLNAETMLNIYYALQGTSVTHKYVTVVDEQNVTVRVPIGMPVQELFKKLGIDTTNKSLIHGGPLMGQVTPIEGLAVSKTTKGLILLPQDHPLLAKKTMAPHMARTRGSSYCCQCTMCTDMCPRYLLGHNIQPHLAMRGTDYPSQPALCSGCGVCTFVACQQDVCPHIVTTHLKAKAKGTTFPDRECNIRSERKYRQIPMERIISRCYLSPQNVYPITFKID